MDTKEILRRMYPEVTRARGLRARLRRLVRFRFRFPRGLSHGLRRLYRRFSAWVSNNAFKIALCVIAMCAWASLHIRYYNRLLYLEFNVQTAHAQIVAEQQRRFHISQSFVRVVIAYAQHERGLMLALTELRMKARAKLGQQGTDATPGAQPSVSDLADLSGLNPDELKAMLPDVMLTAEQYPSLRLSENFQQLATGIIATENRITERIQKYNDICNSYTTELRQFPGIVFGKVWGFKMCEFYEPPEPNATTWMPVPLGANPDGPGMTTLPPQPVPPPPPIPSPAASPAEAHH